MTLTNKRVQYTVEETGQNVKLRGEVSINEDQNTFTVSGSFNQENGDYVGNFYYNEQNGQVVDKNIGGIQKNLFNEASALVDTVVAAIPGAIQNN